MVEFLGMQPCDETGVLKAGNDGSKPCMLHLSRLFVWVRWWLRGLKWPCLANYLHRAVSYIDETFSSYVDKTFSLLIIISRQF